MPVIHETCLNEAGTQALAAAMATALRPGDTVLLSGPVGAGKSALARALIRTWLGDPMAEVPSPSYTLVQTYDHAGVALWHVDLYRLDTTGDEVAELGLDQAFADAICLVEWPERLGAELPRRHLAVDLAPQAAADMRAVTVTAKGPNWEPVLAALPRAGIAAT